jgi:NAD(P)-dependent dehydrogenase (short-subunit alcohol dehydrogenase family)
MFSVARTPLRINGLWRRFLPSVRGGFRTSIVAAAALFLASEEAAYISGALLFVDGGQLA